MIISFGESQWPGTSPRPGENRRGRLQVDHARLICWGGGGGGEGASPTASLSRPQVEPVMSATRFNSFILSFAKSPRY